MNIMASRINCCHKCPDRWVKDGHTCHSTCKKYKEAVKKNEAEKALIREQKRLENLLYEISK